MKKVLALVALFIGSAAVIFGLSILNLWAVLFLSVFGLLLGIAAVVGLGFAQAALQRVFERKTGLSWVRFMLWAYLPSAAGSIVYFIVVLMLDKAGYFKGFFAGLGEFIIGLAWSITSVAALAAGGLILWLMSRHGERKGQL